MGAALEPRLSDTVARSCLGSGTEKAPLGFLLHPLVLFLFYLWRLVGPLVGWLVFMPFGHEPFGGGMVAVSRVSAKPSAGSVRGAQADGSWRAPREPTPREFPCSIFFFFYFTFIMDKFLNTKGKLL